MGKAFGCTGTTFLRLFLRIDRIPWKRIRGLDACSPDCFPVCFSHNSFTWMYCTCRSERHAVTLTMGVRLRLTDVEAELLVPILLKSEDWNLRTNLLNKLRWAMARSPPTKAILEAKGLY